MPKIERAGYIWRFYEMVIWYGLLFLFERFLPRFISPELVREMVKMLPHSLQDPAAEVLSYVVLFFAAIIAAAVAIWVLGMVVLFPLFPEEILTLADWLKADLTRRGTFSLVPSIIFGGTAAMGGWLSGERPLQLVLLGYGLFVVSILFQVFLLMRRLITSITFRLA